MLSVYFQVVSDGLGKLFFLWHGRCYFVRQILLCKVDSKMCKQEANVLFLMFLTLNIEPLILLRTSTFYMQKSGKCKKCLKLYSFWLELYTKSCHSSH